MASPNFPRRRVRRISGDAAAALPTFNLLREQRQRDAMLGRLSGLRRSVMEEVAALYQNMFNDAALRLTASSWSERMPQADFWLAATCLDKADQVVYFGLSGPTLFKLSDLFFGGVDSARSNTAEAGDDSVQRSVTETEERLAKKVFHYQLLAQAYALGLAASDWEIRWVEEGPQDPMPTSEITLGTEQLKISWQFCWPVTLDIDRVVDVPPDLGERITTALTQIPVRLRVEVGGLSATLGHLETLKAGDVLPLNLHEQAIARIGDVVCCRGRVAEQGNGLVLQTTAWAGVNDGR